jgi:hypothetical protein
LPNSMSIFSSTATCLNSFSCGIKRPGKGGGGLVAARWRLCLPAVDGMRTPTPHLNLCTEGRFPSYPLPPAPSAHAAQAAPALAQPAVPSAPRPGSAAPAPGQTCRRAPRRASPAPPRPGSRAPLACRRRRPGGRHTVLQASSPAPAAAAAARWLARQLRLPPPARDSPDIRLEGVGVLHRRGHKLSVHVLHQHKVPAVARRRASRRARSSAHCLEGGVLGRGGCCGAGGGGHAPGALTGRCCPPLHTRP